MTTIIVNTNRDDANGPLGNGLLTLRDAIAMAAPNDVITFARPMTIDLNATLVGSAGQNLTNGSNNVDIGDFLTFNANNGHTVAWTADTRVAWTATSYDQIGDVTKKVSGNNAGDPLSTESYVYDSAGRLTVKTTLEGSTTTFSYDASGQLLGEKLDGSMTSYQYDATGNRTTVIASGKGAATGRNVASATGATAIPCGAAIAKAIRTAGAGSC